MFTISESILTHNPQAGAVPPFAISRLAGKAISVIRPSLFPYLETREELDYYTGLLFETLRGGKLKIKIHEIYPLEEVARAHDDLEGRKTTGKLLLRP